MAGPVLESLDTFLAVSDDSAESLGLTDVTERAFVVVGEGSYAGRHWRCGEVLLCDPAAEGASKGPVVLAARGPGRPRLGRFDKAGVWGDAGEPCNPIRWEVVGRVREIRVPSPALRVACERVNAQNAGIRAFGRPSFAHGPRWGNVGPRRAVPAPQLSLFASRAAA